MHSYAKSMSSSFLLFVLPRNEVLYLENNHFLSKWSIFQQKEKLKKVLLSYYLFSSASSKTRQKKDKRNVKLVVILKSPESNFDNFRFQQSYDASKIIMLLVTRWLQALTISYLIGVFEIMIMPIEMFGTVTAKKFNGNFILRIKNKGDLRVERCQWKVMIKTKNKFSISFGSELKWIYN